MNHQLLMIGKYFFLDNSETADIYLTKTSLSDA